MRAPGVLIILLVARVSAAEHFEPPAEWTVDPPAGWQEDAEARGQMARAAKQLEMTREARSLSWKNGSTDLLNLLWLVMSSSASTEKSVDAFDRGFLRSATKALGASPTVTDLPRRVEGTMVIRESTADVGSIRTRFVRRYQAARDGMHVLILTCTARVESQCLTSLDLARFSVPNATALEEPRSRAEIAGEVTGFLVVMLVVLWFVRRKLRAR